MNKATRDKRWLRHVRRVCKQRQAILGAVFALTAIFGWWAFSEFLDLFEYGLLALYFMGFGFYLILTKRNYAYEIFLESRKERLQEERMERIKYAWLVQKALH